MEFDSAALDQLKICQKEISDYKWVPLEEYEAFCKDNSIGTQLFVAQEVSWLHREGRLLGENLPFKYETQEGRSLHTFWWLFKNMLKST